ncbi:MAG: CoA transferase, partial [Dehalococcoidia bacterium]
GKLGVTIDLKNPEGVEQARRLIAISDVVVENYSPRVMKGFGLDYASLIQLKPDIIYLALSGFGATGPDRDNVLYGEGQVALNGLSSLTGYAGGEPLPLPIPYPDPVGAMHGLIAVLAALRHRNDTGEGQYIDISQWESAMCLMPEGLLEYTMNQRVPPRIGNRDQLMAPHGCYPCRGEDKWIAIAVGTEEEWGALCRAIGRPDLIVDQRYATLMDRRKRQDELDEIIAGWTAQHPPYEAMEVLQKAGVAATPSLNNEEAVKEPHLNQRGFFVEVDHPATGPRVHPGLPFRFGESPIPIKRAPLLGEHNGYVFRQLLGFTPGEVARLEKEGVLR